MWCNYACNINKHSWQMCYFHQANHFKPMNCVYMISQDCLYSPVAPVRFYLDLSLDSSLYTGSEDVKDALGDGSSSIILTAIFVERRRQTSSCSTTDWHPWRLRQRTINLGDSHPRQLQFASDKLQGDNLSPATSSWDSFPYFLLYHSSHFLDKYDIKLDFMFLLQRE